MPGKYRDERIDCIMNLVYFEEKPFGFFGGVVTGGVCGVGIIFKLNVQHFFRGYLVVGAGTNNKAKFLGLWCLL